MLAGPALDAATCVGLVEGVIVYLSSTIFLKETYGQGVVYASFN